MCHALVQMHLRITHFITSLGCIVISFILSLLWSSESLSKLPEATQVVWGVSLILEFMCVFVCANHSVTSNSFRPHGLQHARILCPWDSPGKNTGMGCCALLQGIFPTQGLNPGLLHGRQIFYCLRHLILSGIYVLSILHRLRILASEDMTSVNKKRTKKKRKRCLLAIWQNP